LYKETDTFALAWKLPVRMRRPAIFTAFGGKTEAPVGAQANRERNGGRLQRDRDAAQVCGGQLQGAQHKARHERHPCAMPAERLRQNVCEGGDVWHP